MKREGKMFQKTPLSICDTSLEKHRNYNVITQCLHLQCRHFFYLKIINCYVAITTLCWQVSTLCLCKLCFKYHGFC